MKMKGSRSCERVGALGPAPSAVQCTGRRSCRGAPPRIQFLPYPIACSWPDVTRDSRVHPLSPLANRILSLPTASVLSHDLPRVSETQPGPQTLPWQSRCRITAACSEPSADNQSFLTRSWYRNPSSRGHPPQGALTILTSASENALDCGSSDLRSEWLDTFGLGRSYVSLPQSPVFWSNGDRTIPGVHHTQALRTRRRNVYRGRRNGIR